MLGPMRFTVRHETLYRYSVPVVLAPHVLRLTPRSQHQLQDPVVGGSAGAGRAARGERRVRQSRCAGEVLRSGHRRAANRQSLRAGNVTGAGHRGGLRAIALDPAFPDEVGVYQQGAVVDAAVVAFARAVAAEVGQQPVAFLRIASAEPSTRAPTSRCGRRADAQAAGETLASWQGACRDFTVLFMDSARSLGMSARFCSGYQAAADTPDGRRYLHGWPEVFVPGLGWRGWDPTHGVAAGEGHVALCAAPNQAGTMPVVGGFYFDGSSITSTLDFDLHITTT